MATDAERRDEDESEAANIFDLYRRHGESFASQRSQELFEQTWLDRFISLLGPEQTVLDLGCGSGQPLARYLHEYGCSVTGVDSSESLIEIAQRSAPDSRWVLADMRDVNLGQRFDGILTWHSFFHLTPADQRSMFSRFREHAKNGAALMFTTGVRYGHTIATWQGEALYHGSLDLEEYRELLSSNGFDLVSHVPEDPECERATVWLARAG